ncbi:hypothetical protein [Actinomadura sp. WMMB 499]|uniref:hypothetical protein n=1 Tax=Actinomadura sp. WMMB 499 TaxID=1219491 RepID=UPI00124891BA|nr:hypothetical protein [Actinomadura sp. WMMB 499]QFG24671.1 hypothetical protein F7P10_29530 [Actinomadura sp. WMMB 499]
MDGEYARPFTLQTAPYGPLTASRCRAFRFVLSAKKQRPVRRDTVNGMAMSCFGMDGIFAGLSSFEGAHYIFGVLNLLEVAREF